MTASGDVARTRPISFMFMSGAAATFSWLTLVAIGRLEGPTTFAQTSALWGFYFGLVGILFGYQQEVTRRVSASNSIDPTPTQRITLLAQVATLAAALAFLVSLAVLPRLGRAGWGAAAILAIGCSAYTVLSCLNGTLASRRRWGLLGLIVIGDSVIRLACLLVVTAHSTSLPLTAAAIAAGGLIWLPLMANRSIRSAAFTGALIRGPGVRVIWSMAISGCSALLVAGFPTLVLATSRSQVEAVTGSGLAMIGLIRAPLIVAAGPVAVVIMSARSSQPSSRATTPRSRAYFVAATLSGGATVGAYAWGPRLLSVVFSSSFMAGGALAAGALLSSGLFVVLFISGTKLMAADMHRAALAGWVVALSLTLATLGLPIAEEPRMIAALTIPLALGIGTHAFLGRQLGGT